MTTDADAEDRRLVESALAGNEESMNRLVARLEPIVRMRAGRALMRRRREARGRDLRVEMQDFMQEVFAALFAKRGRALAAWDPTRGMSLDGFVGFLAEREVNAVLRTGRRSPWTEDPTLDAKLDYLAGATKSPEGQLEARETLLQVANRMKERLSPLGLLYFQRLFIEQRSVASLSEECGVSTDALYAWRSRLGRTLKGIRDEIAREASHE